MWRSKLATSGSAAEWAPNSGWWQLPQSGALASCASRTRLVVWQCGQTMCSVGDSVIRQS